MENVALEVIKEWGLMGLLIVIICAVCGFLSYLYYQERKNSLLCKSNNNNIPLDTIISKFDNISDKIDLLKEKFDDKLNLLEEKFDDKMDLLDKKFDEKIDLLEDNVDDKIVVLKDRINNLPKENIKEFIKREDELAEAERKLHEKALDDIFRLGDEIFEMLNDYTQKINCTHLFVGSFHNGSSSLQGLPYIKFNIIREAFHISDIQEADHPFAPVYRDCDLSLLGKLPQMLVQKSLLHFTIDENNQSEMFKYDGQIVRRMIGMGIKQLVLHTLKEQDKNGKTVITGFVGCVKYDYEEMNLGELKSCAAKLEKIHNSN